MRLAGESLRERWAALRPHVEVHGPSGRRPTALLFHGCGGIRPQMADYARAAVDAGWRAVVVDSFAPRGWSRTFALTVVCTGAALRGPQRAGDVLAAAWGAIHDLEADPDCLALAGWSHGAWSIMDLMTMPLSTRGGAGLADPDPRVLDGAKGLFLGYPYGGIGALSRTRPWRRAPKVLAVLAERDHVTRPPDSMRCYEAVRAAGADLEIWSVPAAHAFDELDTPLTPMRHDAALAAESLRRFRTFLTRLAACA